MFFNVESGLLTLAKEELRNNVLFRAVLERDKGSDGDHDGRKKYKAFKEFYYVWWVCDVRSPGVRAGYNDKELSLQGIKEARLETNYKPDKLIKDVIAYYKEEQSKLLITGTAVTNLIKGIRLADVLCQRIIGNMEQILQSENEEQKMREDLIDKGETPPPINIIDMAGKTQALISQYDQLIAIANKTPKTLAVLEELETKLKKEESGSITVRGGHKKGNRSDPK
jgi:hypothetical protein